MSRYLGSRLTTAHCVVLSAISLLVYSGCTSGTARLPFNPFGSPGEAENADVPSELLSGNMTSPPNDQSAAAPEPNQALAASASLPPGGENSARTAVAKHPTDSAARSRLGPKPEAGLTPSLVGPAVGTDSAPQPSAQLASATRSAPALVTLEDASELGPILGQTPGTVILDFYADWCGPCQKQSKVFHELQATAARNGSTIVKIDVDQHAQLKKQFQVTKLPTLYVFKQGAMIHRQEGLVDSGLVEGWLSE